MYCRIEKGISELKELIGFFLICHEMKHTIITYVTKISDQVVTKPAKQNKIGDFNIPWDVPCAAEVKDLFDMLHPLQ